jgi:hypothetical protein
MPCSMFGSVASLPPPHFIVGSLSTSSVTLTPSERPLLEPNTPIAHGRTDGALSRFGDLYPMSSG